MDLQEKVLGTYRKLGEFYRGRADLELGGQRYNSTLLLALVGFLNRVCVVLFGDYGQGKTTVAELVAAVMGGLPYPSVVMSEVRGSPEITEEKLVAAVDLGKLSQGQVEVLWSAFVKCPVHIIDEITRIPEIKQAMVLEGIRTGQWLYLGKMLRTGRSALFATANVEDLSGGSFEIIPALMDRFALGLDASYPGVSTCLELALNSDFEAKLEDAGLLDRYGEAAALLAAKDHDPLALSAFREEFKQHLEARGFSPLYQEELDQVRDAIHRVPVSEEGTQFMAYLISALSFCVKGQKRGLGFGEDGGAQRGCPKDCRFADTPCAWVLGGGSRRQERDIVNTARALAWIAGADRVDVEHLRTAAPFCLWHRREFSSQLMKRTRSGVRRHRYPAKLEAAALFTEQLHKDFTEMRPLLEDVYDQGAELEAQLASRGWVQLRSQKLVRAWQLPPHVQDLLEMPTLEPVQPASRTEEG